MRSKFDEQLVELNHEMIKMGTMIEESIAQAVNALCKKDVELAKKIMEGDEEIDRAQKRIENICFNLLIQQQPVARDLRTITAAMKMVTDMERIGDHAADISEMTISMGKSAYEANLSHINKMASETVLMLNWSIEAYVSKDKQKAQDVIEKGRMIQSIFKDTLLDGTDEASKEIFFHMLHVMEENMDNILKGAK